MVYVAILAKNEIAPPLIEMKIKPDALVGLTSSDSFGLNLVEVVSQPSLLVCLLEALYLAASSCSAQGHGGLQKFVLWAIL